MSQPVNKSAPSTPGSKTKPARKRAKASILSIAYPNACGIDIGATSHFVAVPSDRDDCCRRPKTDPLEATVPTQN